MPFLSADQRYKLFSVTGYNIPKPKFMYWVNIVSPYINNQTKQSISFFTKQIDRIGLTYDLQEYNQYNKKRLAYSKIRYNPVSMVIHDTVDDACLKFVTDYNKYYFNDFKFKNNESWIYDNVTSNFESSGQFGLDASKYAGNFIDRIEIYEIYDQVYSKINFINPKFASVEFHGLNVEESGGNEVSISFNYEGVVVEAMSQPVTPEIADIVGLPYRIDAGLGRFLPSIGGVPIDSIFGELGSVLNTTGLSGVLQPIAQAAQDLGISINPINIITNSSHVFGSRVNSVFRGKMGFENILDNGSIATGVFNRTSKIFNI